MPGLFPPFDPEPEAAERPGRLRRIPIRSVIPNLVTLLSLCAGLTSIRMGFEGRVDMAVYAILVAAVLDGLDGRLARYLRVTSKFGAELDSLSDFLSFGVAPPLLLFVWNFHDINSFGWVAVVLFAIAGALRLARFNTMLGEDKPAWQSNFFTGVPIPAGALAVLLPIYVDRVGIDVPQAAAPAVVAYVVLIAALMVSRVPTFSGKKYGGIQREWVVPILIGVVILAMLLVSYPFHVLSILTILYLAYIPFGWRAWNRLARAHGAKEDELTLDVGGPFPDDETTP
ncbi:CDP-diacylglycerol--serine O-phosphatidyltransferase [Pleomorphomonas diazotrophica]|uniref:CDP-diacylglycerol--serine O-phosphatidyltransferase n=1 Tax=Pleomorphomonas diazotrophica TaxID=1166257 RepID=A0A1I4QV74_9HYPH|nr:CDP-diacylglycerol--serine O-phosphatidyltransferase [Pleomorphomonas diazotrophica]PKR90402.1 CDP-diacylglycerol--serine O-phosphatidyltransferase [Pleomorphomonas diazotrophica]SFM43968.1 CDP-diacylglycerol---serine O-phosphatidyltransferase [Pleomorphomonas diazotrophica]